jgi:GT2 family glycosyltransferase
MNYYYDKSGKYLLKEPYKIMQKDAVESVTGGLFLIKADVWSKVNGMNPIFKKSQDIDLGLRLAKKGYYLLRKKEIAAIHHTKAYLDKSRAWKDLFSWNHLYARSLLYRQHVFNKHMYHRLLRNDYSMLILFLTLLFSLFFPNKWMFIIIPYFLILLLKTLRKRGNNNMYFKSIFHFLRDLTALFGLFIFWPKDKFINKYSKC